MGTLATGRLGAAVLILAPGTGFAQGAPAPADAPVATGAPATPDSTAAPSGTGTGSDLGEIVVTAQKRAESLQRVPIAVTAVTAAELQTFHVSNNLQLAALTPGLNFTQSTIAAQPWIRGIGNSSGVPGNEPAVATYVDGVYRPSPVSAWFSYNSVENIQVLKGPQGTLFGRNATGGVISITTKKPDFKPLLDVSAGYGNYNTLSGSLYVSGGITDSLAADLSVSDTDQLDGFGRDLQRNTDVFRNRSLSLRSKWFWRIGDTTTATFSADYDRTKSDQGIALAVLPGTISDSGYAHAGGYYDTNSAIKQRGQQKQGGGALTLEHGFDWATLTSITAYRKLRSTGIENADPVGYNYSIFINAKENTLTQEINLQSVPRSPLRWIVGFYYFDDKAYDYPQGTFGNFFGNPTGGPLIFGKQSTRSYAVYGQTSIPLFNEKGHLTLGGRYTRDTRSIRGFAETSPGNFALSGPPAALNFNPAVPRSATAGKFTYRIAYDHQITNDLLGYASYSVGFKSGNYNVTSPTTVPTKAETLYASEVGAKSEWFNRRLRINGALFYYKFHDLQVKSIINGRSADSNAAEAEYYGGDLDADALLTRGLVLKGSLSYVHARYKSYKVAPIVSILPNGNVVGAGFGNLTGNRVALVDPFSGSLTLQYSTDVSFGQLNVSANASYHHGYYADAQNFVKQPSYTLLGASTGWTSKSKNWTVDVWGQNLLNQKYFVIASISAAIGQLYSPASPATFGIRVSRRFR